MKSVGPRDPRDQRARCDVLAAAIDTGSRAVGSTEVVGFYPEGAASDWVIRFRTLHTMPASLMLKRICSLKVLILRLTCPYPRHERKPARQRRLQSFSLNARRVLRGASGLTRDGVEHC